MASISDSIYSIHWYNYPAKFSKNVYLIMLIAQKPYYIHGGKMITCSLETFTSVSWALSNK